MYLTKDVCGNQKNSSKQRDVEKYPFATFNINMLEEVDDMNGYVKFTTYGYDNVM